MKNTPSHHVANININNNNINNNNNLGVAADGAPASTRNSRPEKQKKKRQKLKRHIDIDKLPAEQTNLVPNGQRQAGGADNAAAADDALFCPCCGHPKEGTMWVEGNGRSQFLKLVGSDMGGFKFCTTCYGRHYYHVRGRKATPTPYDERCKLFLKFNPNGPKGEKFPLPYPPPPTTPVTLPPPPAPTPHAAPRLGSKVSRLSGGMPQHGEPAFLDACVLEKRIRASATDANGNRISTRVDPSTGELLGPFPAMLLSPVVGNNLMDALTTFREAKNTALTPRLVELAVLRTAAHAKASYAFWSHTRLAAAVGIDLATIQALRDGDAERLDGLCDRDKAALEVTDACLHGTQLGGTAFTRAVATLGHSGVFELISLVGLYRTLADTLRVFEIGAPSNPFAGGAGGDGGDGGLGDLHEVVAPAASTSTLTEGDSDDE